MLPSRVTVTVVMPPSSEICWMLGGTDREPHGGPLVPIDSRSVPKKLTSSVGPVTVCSADDVP